MNEAIENSVCFPAHTANVAAATGLYLGMEADPLAHGRIKGQKIVAITPGQSAVGLEYPALGR